MATQAGSFLATRRGRLTLLLLCAVQFLDIADSSIMNVALPSIRRDLGFSVQGLQWVLSGYLLTYGGFLLLGGRAADLLGRRRLLVAGTTLFAACSLAGGLAADAGMLVGARLGQGIGAAMMAPAGLSILTTTFSRGHRPEPGARRVGRRLRACRRHRRVPGRRAVPGPGLALGLVRQPAGLRGDRPRCLPPGPGPAPPRGAGGLRPARRGPGHRRHAAARLRAGESPRPGLGRRPHDRRARRRGCGARRLRARPSGAAATRCSPSPFSASRGWRPPMPRR